MSQSDTVDEYFGEHDATPMSPEPGKVTVIISGTFVTETPKAVLIKAVAATGEYVDAWLPKSQFKRDMIITELDEAEVTLFIPTWLAEAKEIVYGAYIPEDWKDFENGTEAKTAGQIDLPLNKF